MPTVLTEILADKDAAKERRVMHAMLKMDRIDIPALKKACNQKSQRDPLVVKSELQFID